MTTSPAFTFEALDANGNVAIKIYVFAKEENGGVTFSFVTEKQDGYEDWRIDLNGFFLDLDGDGGPTKSVGSKANNMNGGNNDGYDYAVGLGSVGGKDKDWTSGDIFIADLTLESLMGADAGLRATSYGPNGEGSLKLVADYTPPEGPPPPPDDFPEWQQDISNIVLVFDTTAGDAKPSPDGDGYYTVKIDNWPGAAGDDLDDSIAAILAWLETNDPVFQQAAYDAEELLLGAIIKGGQQTTGFYAYGDNNTNGTAPDALPAGLALSLPVDDPNSPNNEGAGNATPTSAIDKSYDYDAVFA